MRNAIVLTILAVPEQEPDGADWGQRLWILRLPRGY